MVIISGAYGKLRSWVTRQVAIHAALPSAHHSKYTDTEAVSAHNKRCFGVSRNAGHSCPNAVFDLFPFDIIDFDTANEFNVTTHRYTPQVEGYYFIHLALVWIEILDGKKFIISIYKNNQYYVYDRGISGGPDLCGGVASALIYLNGSTDYITAKGYQNNGASQSYHQPFCKMSGGLYMEV